MPKLALTNPILLNAMFLVASMHIKRTNKTYPAEPFQYHERVLKLLIPHLAENGGIGDDGTLAATILLRGFEEFVGKCCVIAQVWLIYINVRLIQPVPEARNFFRHTNSSQPIQLAFLLPILR